MAVIQPDTFAVTDAEAAELQSVQLRHQQKMTGITGVIRYGSMAAALAMVAAAVAIDWIWYAGRMPIALFVTLLGFYFAGAATLSVGYWFNLQATKRALRQKTRQVSEPHTVRLTDEGIEQSLPDMRSLYLWRGIDRIEQASGLIVIWAGNLMVSAVPVRAFPSEPDAQAFVDACRQRAGSSTGGANLGG